MKKTVLDLVGNTPLVYLSRLSPVGIPIFAKLEGYNPTGSVKDRPAKLMIECAENSGVLDQGKTIVEPTSGNTGIALSMIATLKGYQIILVMPENMSMERRLIMQAYGAKLVLTPQDLGVDGAIRKAREMTEQNHNFVMLDQFSNPCNVKAHWEGTGWEIWNQTAGKVTHFVAGIGTGGTIMGAGKRLKSLNSNIKIIGVEPSAETPIQGLKNLSVNQIPSIIDQSQIDERLYVTIDEAYYQSRQLAVTEGIFAGISSGAAMVGALRTAKSIGEGYIVVVFPDGGEKYLSTPLYNGNGNLQRSVISRGENSFQIAH